MYAAKKFYVQNWPSTPDKHRFSVTVTRGGSQLRDINCERISAVEESVMYWRKANHIHAWFVDNVQSGRDDCGTYVVEKNKLRELLSVCEKVIAASKLVGGTVFDGTLWSSESSEPVVLRHTGRVIEDPTVAKELLPTRAGFFFGSLRYDEEYLNDVIETRDWARKTLSELDGATTPVEINYSSSW